MTLGFLPVHHQANQTNQTKPNQTKPNQIWRSQGPVTYALSYQHQSAKNKKQEKLSTCQRTDSPFALLHIGVRRGRESLKKVVVKSCLRKKKKRCRAITAHTTTAAAHKYTGAKCDCIALLNRCS